MSHKLYQVTDFEIVGDYTIHVKFDDASERTINFEPILHGEVFGPLRVLTVFNQVELNSEARTLVWPTGGDFDPETLRNWNAQAMTELGQYWATIAVVSS